MKNVYENPPSNDLSGAFWYTANKPIQVPLNLEV